MVVQHSLTRAPLTAWCLAAPWWPLGSVAATRPSWSWWGWARGRGRGSRSHTLLSSVRSEGPAVCQHCHKMLPLFRPESAMQRYFFYLLDSISYVINVTFISHTAGRIKLNINELNKEKIIKQLLVCTHAILILMMFLHRNLLALLVFSLLMYDVSYKWRSC